MTSASVFYVDRTVDAKYLFNTSAFGDGVLDEQQKYTISLLVQEEVERLTSSARFTISRTSAKLITDKQMAEWHLRQDSYLMVTHTQIVSVADLSTSAPTSI